MKPVSKDGDQSFPRTVRLTDASQYSRVFADPVRVSDKAFTLLARSNTVGYPRLGLAISKKNVRQAVARQWLKRLIRESFRKTRKRLPALDIVVMCRPVAQDMTNDEIRAKLDTHWRKLSSSTPSR